MLHDFLTRERSTILAEAKRRALESRGTRLTSEAVEAGWGIFYDELIDLLERDQPFEFQGQLGAHTAVAEKHGKEYLRLGYTVSEVVHSYGIICQAITSLATQLGFNITSREFQQLNLSLDTAIAEAVSEFEKLRSENVDRAEVKRLGFLAHELRNCLQSASVALEMIESGIVGVRSGTGSMLQNSLKKMAELIDVALTEVRLRSEPKIDPIRTRVFELMSEVGVTSGFDARSRNLTLLMQGFSDLEVDVDRQLFVSALANLVQNALKFSKPGGTVQVRTRQDGDRVLIEVEDECGGLPPGKSEELFTAGVQKDKDRTGMGLGLAISRQAIELNKGKLRVENLPGKGCIFIIDLPKPVAA
ncbi:MAG: HAMP domain-containing sensor histidine kinase [Bacteroidota bacterium]|nr:HAMP domain-containing sensor histidine kinase [Bacteroidota bacterium]